ncbi:hypothetical protein [Falsirhodobacter algicola]|nr:hypothetical protein [Falsirhodobacter algicola]
MLRAQMPPIDRIPYQALGSVNLLFLNEFLDALGEREGIEVHI